MSSASDGTSASFTNTGASPSQQKEAARGIKKFEYFNQRWMKQIPHRCIG
jgi:hypothetical protein